MREHVRILAVLLTSLSTVTTIGSAQTRKGNSRAKTVFDRFLERAHRYEEGGPITSAERLPESAPRQKEFPRSDRLPVRLEEVEPGVAVLTVYDHETVVFAPGKLGGSKQVEVPYEVYRLTIDDAIRRELDLIERTRAARKKRADEAIAAAKKRIEKVSGGELSYGMGYPQVVKLWGEPKERLGPPVMLILTGTYVFENGVALRFHGGGLVDAGGSE